MRKEQPQPVLKSSKVAKSKPRRSKKSTNRSVSASCDEATAVVAIISARGRSAPKRSVDPGVASGKRPRKQRDYGLTPFQVELLDLIDELSDAAFGLQIWQKLHARHPDQYTLAHVYMSLRRFEARGLISIQKKAVSPIDNSRTARVCNITDMGRVYLKRYQLKSDAKKLYQSKASDTGIA